MSEIGHNYRLTEIQAVLARWNLARFDDLLRLRRAQASALCAALADVPGLRWRLPRDWEEWNGFSPVATLDLPRPRELASRLATAGVPNSVGSFALVANDLRPVFARFSPATCSHARHFIETALAVVLSEHDSEQDIGAMADTVAKEISRWA